MTESAAIDESFRSPLFMQRSLTVQVKRLAPAFDHRGCALPLPFEEESRRATEAIRALDALAKTDDDEEQVETFAALVEAVDQDRASDRRRFAE